MESVNSIWPAKKIKLNDRIKIYKSIIKSVLTYNYATWGLTKAQTEELDRAHRKKLRKVTRNPFMKNKRLYEITKETPLSEQMRQARWRLLGHILRLDRNTPCQKAVDHYFEVPECAKNIQTKRGQHYQ